MILITIGVCLCRFCGGGVRQEDRRALLFTAETCFNQTKLPDRVGQYTKHAFSSIHFFIETLEPECQVILKYFQRINEIYYINIQ